MTKNNSKNRILIVILLTIAGGFIYAMNCGIRNNYGIMLKSIVENSGTTIASVSFVFAVAQLTFGVVQPLFGILASKKGNFLTLAIGAILTTSGMLLAPYSKSILTLTICIGILLPAGTGALSYGLIIGSVSTKISQKYMSTVSGIINASSGLGNSLMSPLLNTLIVGSGLAYAMKIFSIPMLAIIPVSYLICKNSSKKVDDKVDNKEINTNAGFDTPISNKKIISTKELFTLALTDRTYILLMIGFFTCGFHMAIITNHLPTEFMSFGFSSQQSSYAFSIYGITTIIGSVAAGILCDKFKMKNVLAFLYGLRPLTIILFFIVPKTIFTITLIAGLFGISGASTVSPVSGIIGKNFGSKYLATLFGFVFLLHQIGGFISAWLGGILFEMMNSYSAIWTADILLCTLAAIVSYMIYENKKTA